MSHFKFLFVGLFLLLLVGVFIPTGVASAQSVRILIPSVQAGKDYVDPVDETVVAAEAETQVNFHGMDVKLTNVRVEDGELKISDRDMPGQVEIVDSHGNEITCFVAIDWDTVMADANLWTVVEFKNNDGTSWSLKTTMENNKRRTVCDGDESGELLK